MTTTEYEAQRLANIERNARFLSNLGLGNGLAASAAARPEHTDSGRTSNKRRAPPMRRISDIFPLKKSRRLAGEKAPDLHLVRGGP